MAGVNDIIGQEIVLVVVRQAFAPRQAEVDGGGNIIVPGTVGFSIKAVSLARELDLLR